MSIKITYVLLTLFVPIVLPANKVSKTRVEDHFHERLDPNFTDDKALQENGKPGSGSSLDGRENRKSFHDFLAAEELDIGENDVAMGISREESGNLPFDGQLRGSSRASFEEPFLEDDTHDVVSFSEEHSMRTYRESRQREHASQELPHEEDFQEDGGDENLEESGATWLDELVDDEGMLSSDHKGNFIQANASDGSEENEKRYFWTASDSIEKEKKTKKIRDPDLLKLNPLSSSGHLVVSNLTEADFNDAVNKLDYTIISFLGEGCQRCDLFRPHFAAAARTFWDMEDTDNSQVVFFYEITDLQLMVKFNLRELPTVFFFRSGIPILYEGDLSKESLVTWMFAHMEVMGWELQEENFDIETQKKKADGSSQPWLINFCNVDTAGCDGFMATWESTAYRLHGIVEFGYVDVAIEVTLAKRFDVDVNNLPAVVLLKDDQIFRCTLPLMELTTNSLINFIQKGHMQNNEEHMPSKLGAFTALIVRAGAHFNVVLAAVVATAVVLYAIYIYVCRRKRLAESGKQKGV